MTRTKTTGKSNRHPREEKEAPPPITLSAYPGIEFGSEAFRNNFVALAERRMNATRCVSKETLEELGIEKEVQDIFKVLGLEGLYNLNEVSYRYLTLEFLSSFSYDKSKHTVNFRLKNTTHNLTVNAFAGHLGVRKRVKTALDGIDKKLKATEYFGLYSNETDPLVGGMRANDVQHPALRIFLRLLTYILYGRSDVRKLNSSEVLLLSSYLNPFREDGFVFNPISLVCQAFEKMAISDQCVLECGALVTRLAKSLMKYEPGEIDRPLVAMSLNMKFLKSILWVEVLARGKYAWKAMDGWYMRLPAEEGAMPKTEHLEAVESPRPQASYYTIPDDHLHRIEDLREASKPTPPPINLPSGQNPLSGPPPSYPCGPTQTPPDHGYPPHSSDIAYQVNIDLVMRDLHEMTWNQGMRPTARPSYWSGFGNTSGIFKAYGVSPSGWRPGTIREDGHLLGPWAGPHYASTSFQSTMPQGGRNEEVGENAHEGDPPGDAMDVDEE